MQLTDTYFFIQHSNMNINTDTVCNAVTATRASYTFIPIPPLQGFAERAAIAYDYCTILRGICRYMTRNRNVIVTAHKNTTPT